MPEGDTLYRAARALHRALANRPITRFESKLAQPASVARDSPVAGSAVEQVVSQGKHLLMHFTNGLTLRSHMRMSGSWHLYRPGERWQRPPSRARLTVETADWLAIAFDVIEAELLTQSQLQRHTRLRKLGPDLLATEFNPDEALRRFRERPELTLADALLNQQLVSGAGNVFKSELLFLAGLHPFRTVAQTTDEQLREVISLSRKHLAQNVLEDSPDGIVTYRGLRRTTRNANPEERLWVYGRIHQPCRRCGTTILMERRGPAGRSTYFCPACQPPGQ